MNTDVLTIGGGFFGCIAALQARQHGADVVLCEQHNALLSGASFANQARIHHGYHYPRNLLTARRSQANYAAFCEEFADCIHTDFVHYYALSQQASKTTAAQFQRFCQTIGAPLHTLPAEAADLFNMQQIQAAFSVREHAFDSHKLAQRLHDQLIASGVQVKLNTPITQLQRHGNQLMVSGNDNLTITAKHVFNCTYHRLNSLLRNTHAELIPLKHEWAELALVRMPPTLHNVAITVMDGPFFSCMPFPPKPGLHTLSHVRYTPRYTQWEQPQQPTPDFSLTANSYTSQSTHMLRDAARYVPLLANCHYHDSLWTYKTVLPRNEVDDGRPILFHTPPELPGLSCILGAKIDNIFDIRKHIDHLF